MYKELLDEMINTINEHFLRYGGPLSQKVRYALEQTPRHLFVENNTPYADRPLPIGYEQTISQPFIVAYMTQMLDIDPSHKVLEIGTGSGYQAAVLSYLAKKIYTVERIPELAMKTSKLFDTINQYRHIKVKLDDGCEGWKAHAPYDRIIVTATSQELTPPIELLEQLVVGGKMIIPMKQAIGGNMFGSDEKLHLIHKRRRRNLLYEGGIFTEKLIGVRFVPLIKGENNG
jgi:protein-L-isoaspartate(D-aspartate) O-methyltransferase